MSRMHTNGGLDARRWQNLAQERDDIDQRTLFTEQSDVNVAVRTAFPTTTPTRNKFRVPDSGNLRGRVTGRQGCK